MSICTSLSNLVRLCVVVSLLLAGCNKKNDSAEAAREGIRTRIKQNQRPAPVTSHHARLPPIAWTAKADPPQQADPPTSLNISELEFKDAGNLIYPTSPGKFLVVAPNGRKDGLYHLVNLASGETIGEARGSLDIREPMTISADGKYLAGMVRAKGRTTVVAWSFVAGKQTV
ncbi:MAG TPA: hypothetical protein EYQ75_01390, partial [Planctomycetaceae bacterium]|nr:hypothetical protein [Planctomycetaceae bacterium]